MPEERALQQRGTGDEVLDMYLSSQIAFFFKLSSHRLFWGIRLTHFLQATWSTGFLRMSQLTHFLQATWSTGFPRMSQLTHFLQATWSTGFPRMSQLTHFLQATWSTGFPRMSQLTHFLQATWSTGFLRMSFERSRVHPFASSDHCRAGLPRDLPLKCTLQEGVCESSLHSHMSKPYDLPLFNDLQQCITLPNMPCNSHVYLHVGCIILCGLMHLQQYSAVKAMMRVSRSLSRVYDLQAYKKIEPS